MLLSGFSTSKKSLLTQSIRGFSNTICILAGSPSWDATGAKVMQHLKKNSQEPIQFVGIGGPLMKAEGLEKNYADINVFMNKPCMPYKNHLRAHILQPIHWVTGWIHAANRKAIKQLETNQFPKEVLENNRPNCFVTLGNELFMRNLYQILDRSFKARGIIKPPMFHYDKLIINQRIEYSYYVDHWLYTNPRDPVNWRYYKFPSTFVGPFGVARAIEYLYNTSPQHKNLVSENTLYVSKEYNHEIVDTLVQAERQRFRQKNGIEDSATVFYGLPGNIASEINWAVPLLHGVITEFLKKYSQFTADNFALIIPSDPAIEKDVVAAVNKLKWPVKVVVTKDSNEKYSGLAASDMAAVVNGDAVAECAAYGVPTVILNQESGFQSYVSLLYNSFANDLNIALNGEAYPETLGMCFPAKVVEFWSKWFEDPKSRFGATYRFEKLVPRLMAEVEGQIVDEAAAESKQLIRDGHYDFSKYYFSEYLAAQKILQARDIYYRTAQSNVQGHEIPKVREGMLKQINLA